MVLVKCIWGAFLVFALPLLSKESLMTYDGTKKSRFDQTIKDAREKVVRNWNVLPYLQMEFVAPGVGMCVRSADLPVKMEINFKAATAFGFWDFYITSFSMIYGKKFYHGIFYSGFGGGLFSMNAFSAVYGAMGLKFSPLLDVFIGYESENGFFDLGMDVFRSTYFSFPVQNAYLSAIPTLRYGWKF